MVENEFTLATLAALIQGDRWLNADACAVHLGMITPGGKPNRRGFLERIACRPDFPASNPVTNTWRKSEVEGWASELQRANQWHREHPARLSNGIVLSGLRKRPYKPRPRKSEPAND